MTDELAKFSFQKKADEKIKVIGVGGGGGNAVNHMCEQGIRGVDFVICNTDAQAMESSPVENRIQLGAALTEGRGAGNKPQIGKEAALENIDDVKSMLAGNTKMVFITAGMGGGTGTGGAPVIAKCCNEEGYLTVGIVTIPFKSEGRRRIGQAVEGIAELEQYVDSLLVINNERIREMYGDFGISEAFAKADNILATAAKGIAEIITVPGYVNVDFSDVKTVMRNSGLAVMGTGVANGKNRASEAIEKALISPLLNNNDIRGAKNILLNIISGNKEVTMDEIGQITDFVQSKAGFEADIIWGNSIEEALGEDLSVTVIATGFNTSFISNLQQKKNTGDKLYSIEDDTIGAAKTAAKKQEVPGKKKSTSNIVEFDIEKEQQKEKSDFETLYPTTSKTREKSHSTEIATYFATMSDEDVDRLDNIPAFKRRQLRMNDPQYRKKSSKLSISKENKISDRNSYLHDQVD